MFQETAHRSGCVQELQGSVHGLDVRGHLGATCPHGFAVFRVGIDPEVCWGCPGLYCEVNCWLILKIKIFRNFMNVEFRVQGSGWFMQCVN